MAEVDETGRRGSSPPRASGQPPGPVEADREEPTVSGDRLVDDMEGPLLTQGPAREELRTAGEAPPGFRKRLIRLAGRVRSMRPAGQGLVAFVAYFGIAFGVYALPVVTRFSSAFVATGRNDPKIFLWSLAWWPKAIVEGQNPLFTDALWAPAGVDLSWVTTIPGPSILMWPITEAFGPLVSLNLLHLLAPPLAAWAAFLVCRQATGAFWPSLAGGYFFGFSTFLLNHQAGHPNLVLVFPVALAVYLVVRYARGTLGPLTFLFSLTAVLVGLFSIFTELFATLAVFGGLALLGTFVLGPAHLRGPLLRAAGLIAAAYGLATLLVAPFLIHALGNLPSEPIRSLQKASIDLLGFALPGYTTLIGGNEFRPITDAFTAPPAGNGAYLSLALIFLLIHFAVTRWRARSTWLLLSFVVLTAVAALGPVLHVRGRESIPLPWALVEPIPLIHNALPDRFTMYMWLGVAVIVAVWLAARQRSWFRWGVVVLGASLIFPDLSELPYHQEAPVPAFFEDGAYRRYIEPNEVVLIIPYGRGKGLSIDMMWQAETEMYFRLPSGNVGFVPKQYRGRAVRCLRRDLPQFLGVEELMGFLEQHRIRTVVMADEYGARYGPLLSELGVPPVEVGGVSVYNLRRGDAAKDTGDFGVPEGGGEPTLRGGDPIPGGGDGKYTHC
jgi:hypothetical protein